MLEVVEPLADAVLDVLAPPVPSSRRCASARRAATSTGRRRCRTSRARSSITSQCRPRASNPAAWVAPIDSRPTPYLPARRGPLGDATAGTATSNSGFEYGRRCRRASVRFHIFVWLDTGSSVVSRRMMTSSPSSSSGRVSVGSSPSMMASVGSEPGPTPEHEPAPRHVVELHRPLGDHVRVVVGDADDARAELDVLGPLGRGGDEDLRAGDDLGAGRVVLADPRLVPAEPVEVLDQLEVAFDGERRVLAGLVERRHEDAEAESVGHRVTPAFCVSCRAPAVNVGRGTAAVPPGGPAPPQRATRRPRRRARGSHRSSGGRRASRPAGRRRGPARRR